MIEKDNSLKNTPVLAQIWAVWSILTKIHWSDDVCVSPSRGEPTQTVPIWGVGASLESEDTEHCSLQILASSSEALPPCRGLSPHMTCHDHHFS